MNIPDILKSVGVKDIKQRRMVYNISVFAAIAQGIPQVTDALSFLYTGEWFGMAATMVISIWGAYSALLMVQKKV